MAILISPDDQVLLSFCFTDHFDFLQKGFTCAFFLFSLQFYYDHLIQTTLRRMKKKENVKSTSSFKTWGQKKIIICMVSLSGCHQCLC